MSSALSDPGARLAAAVEQIGQLPVLDRTVQRVLALCRDEDSSTGELTAVLENDAEFATNLLRFANSAYASRPVRVRTIRQAVTMAGESRSGVSRSRRLPIGSLKRLRVTVARRSVSCTSIRVPSHPARLSSRRSGGAVEVAHLGGLLHDIGKLVMPIAFGEHGSIESPNSVRRPDACRARARAIRL